MDIFIICKISLVCGVSASIYVFCSKHEPFIKSCESTLDSISLLGVYGLRTIHYSLGVFLLSYTFASTINLIHDLFVVGLIVCICLHWQIFNGCILVILEKRLLIPENVHIEKMPFLALLGVPKKITDLSDNFIFILPIILIGRLMYYIN
jgi:hypothetical protein